MGRNYIALAIPIFFGLIMLELWVAHRRGRKLLRINDAIANISTGMLQQLLAILCKALLLAGYIVIFDQLRLFELDGSSVWVWIGCFLGVDFAYYWFHRLSHEINFLWAAHGVHHQSEDYNLAVALRQSAIQQFFSSFFYLPLALIGFPPLVFFACGAFNTLYQFWIHTQLIDRLGPMEWIFVTPSNHRVHHGRNPIYIDRNHGGTFVVWDRLFGTFEEEGEKVAFGVTDPLQSWNPIWANLQYWSMLRRAAKQTSSFGDKVRMYLKPPGWFPEELGGFKSAPEIVGEPAIFDRPYPARLNVYACVQFAQITLLVTWFIFMEASYAYPAKLAWVAAVAWALTNLGGLFEGKSWAFASEAARVVAMPLLAWIEFGNAGIAIPIILAASIPFFFAQRADLESFFRNESGAAAESLRRV